MCGIAGVLSFKPKTLQHSEFKNALNQLAKRGPDSEGIFEHEYGFLGHRRLSIIDTSSAANQPMHDETLRYTIVFNGEIFNFKQLKSLHLDSEKFNTNSDTEVLLKLYIKYNKECVQLLEGFFAFAIYDNVEKTLFAARDRFGKKPFNYFYTNEGFYFASELKALYPFGLKKEIDMDILHMYFQLNYVPQPYSLLKNVFKLKPGASLEIDSHGRIKESIYYKPVVQIDKSINYENACNNLDSLLSEAVEKRLISDVPLGAFLSGGIDSSVIVALAKRYTTSLNTFSIGYKDNPIYDETHYANLVAKKFNTNHTVFSLTNKDFLENVYDVLDYLDEPFADSSAIPVFILSKLTRQKVTVALSGDGGDEVFSGYNKHMAEWRARQQSILNTIIRLSYPLTKHLPTTRGKKLTNLFRQINRFAEGANLTAPERYWKWASFYSVEDVRLMFNSQSNNKIDIAHVNKIKSEYCDNVTDESFNEILISDLKLPLAGDMLVKVDMMSMANSLEVRSPFLDHKVVDFAFTLPTEYKINKQLKKRIVQDTFRNILPVELYNRPKQGFEIPLSDWFKKELWGLIDGDLLNSKFIEEQNLFDVNYIENLKDQLFNPKGADVTWRIWSLIAFQYWYKKYFL